MPVVAVRLARTEPGGSPAAGAAPGRGGLCRPGADAAALAGLVALAAALRFPTLDAQGFWLDEAFTVGIVESDLRTALHEVRATESTPPLYYVLAWAWAHVAGTGEAGLRSLSAVVGTLVVPVAYLAGRELVSPRAGLGAALLAAVSPALVWYSQEARAYALLALLGGISFVLFVRLRRRPSWAAAGLWAAASALAVATHYFAAYLVLAQLAALVLARRADRRVLAAGGAVLAAGLALAPLAYWQASEGRTSWIRDIPLDVRLGTALRLVTPGYAPEWAGLTGGSGAAVPGWAFAGAALLVAAAASLATLARGRERRGLLALAVGLSAVAAPLAVSLGARVLHRPLDLFLDRNLLAAWVPLNVALAAGLLVRRAAPVGAVVLAAVAAASVFVVVRTATDPMLQRADWRAFAEAHAAADGVVALAPSYDEHPLRRYAPRLRPLRGERVHVRRVTAVVRSRRRHERLVVPAGLRLAARSDAGNLQVFRYESAAPLAVGPGAVRTPAGVPLLLLVAEGEYASSP